MCQRGYFDAAKAAGIDPTTKAPVPCNMMNLSYATSLVGLLESGNHSLPDFWWEDYGLGGPEVGEYQVLCSKEDGTRPYPKSFGHCMHCYADDVSSKPQLWSAYIHYSQRERKNKRGMSLGI